MFEPSVTTYLSATGKIPFSLTNDYMFRVVLEKNHRTLRGLLSALLHLQPEQITDIEIRNPIAQGKTVQDKEFILDLKLCINHNTLINLEMQVINEHNWPERSLSYLCRAFDQLHRGQEYVKSMPAIHIGILDFQPFTNNTDFYSTYKLLNIKNYHLYSDKFILNVLDLTHINHATKEDKAYRIDQWAKLFKATTWEEIKMIAANNESMNDILQALYECNIDENILDQCYARAERLKKERYFQELEQQEQYLLDAIASKEITIAECNTIIAEHESTIAEHESTIAEHESTIAEHESTIAEHESTIAKQTAALQDKDAEIARLRALLTISK